MTAAGFGFLMEERRALRTHGGCRDLWVHQQPQSCALEVGKRVAVSRPRWSCFLTSDANSPRVRTQPNRPLGRRAQCPGLPCQVRQRGARDASTAQSRKSEMWRQLS